ncbi:MAG: bifunctional (p)ppGpp synthetase/guanosine-3',5'-bis(diphosphate) 3'-pyrophosphohydrolase [Firmicutes bacterium]|nr:bifunctional (p)ppGpp synthetase/guanosine-3',5'-bis(diphosphate) 3'-pyrophosphohydrolase [Bacillota bacterium]MDD4263989.1 bifunctional (p)ppGpp synthetase/guanosine-3',5'-bis(diphosphate) 3'-pyrophosphohydrolase [Bacillota bacterium]MDD4692959.1 bifunctional (p)ppGpp synthetase/guanosine-3',5'-bis(diphosphate) 3'-pyrophosphohydrolase [Bacillota bacterium]
MEIGDLLQRMRQYTSEDGLKLVKKAYEFAKNAHDGQFRESGEAYIEHPLEVSYILADLELDVDTIVAGLLHDVVEDTAIREETIKEEFNEQVALLVDGVTKLEKIPTLSKEEQQAENIRKMFLAMAKDLRVVLIKLADRLNNMRTLRYLSPERQKKNARETLEIYAPLAHRLGMWRIKWELEDLAFRYLYHDEYYYIVEKVAKNRNERETFINDVIEKLKTRLEELDIHAEIYGRPKHFYSIYLKMVKQGKEFEEIYDLTAVRVIVDSVKDCYGVLGTVHTLWKPMPGRFKDYIAMPKSNMYQSLHSTVIGDNGEPFEVQIRTWEMHRTAEYGIAAHWKYKEGSKGHESMDEKLTWLGRILEWQREMKDVEEFMETLKIDLFEDEVFVFTPKGDVVTLPTDSTPVDFAYEVHTAVGNTCVGAKVNGKIVPLDYRLKTGEFVEILTSKHSSPSQDWINFVKTSKAKNRIRQKLRELQREDSIVKGKELLQRECRRMEWEPSSLLLIDKLEELSKDLNYSSIDDLYAAIGYGTITSGSVLRALVGDREYNARKRDLRTKQLVKSSQKVVKPGAAVSVKGTDNMLIKLAKCCSPVPGDSILGYITRGRGVTVHRRDCPNVEDLGDERLLEVTWDETDSGYYPVELHLEGYDRPNLLTSVMAALTDSKTTTAAVNARALDDGRASIQLVVNIESTSDLEMVMNRLRQVRGIVLVTRARPT